MFSAAIRSMEMRPVSASSPGRLAGAACSGEVGHKSVVFHNGVFGTDENHKVGDKKTLRMPDCQRTQSPNLVL
jgi:hypothetical protein